MNENFEILKILCWGCRMTRRDSNSSTQKTSICNWPVFFPNASLAATARVFLKLLQGDIANIITETFTNEWIPFRVKPNVIATEGKALLCPSKPHPSGWNMRIFCGLHKPLWWKMSTLPPPRKPFPPSSCRHTNLATNWWAQQTM